MHSAWSKRQKLLLQFLLRVTYCFCWPSYWIGQITKSGSSVSGLWLTGELMSLKDVTVHGRKLESNSSEDEIRDLLLEIRLKGLRNVITVIRPDFLSRILKQVCTWEILSWSTSRFALFQTLWISLLLWLFAGIEVEHDVSCILLAAGHFGEISAACFIPVSEQCNKPWSVLFAALTGQKDFSLQKEVTNAYSYKDLNWTTGALID